MSIAMTDEQRALRDAITAWAAAAGPIAAVRAREPGAEAESAQVEASWRELWAGLGGLGLPAIAVPEESGGAGGSAVDLAVAVERLAGALVPGPVLPTLLAGLILADHADTPVAKELLPALAEGQRTAAVAFEPGTLAATGDSGADLTLRGTVGPVLGAGEADTLILSARTAEGGLVLAVLDPVEVTLTARTPVDFSRTLADVAVADLVVPAGRVLPADPDRVRELAATLAVAEAAGIAEECLRTATEYAGVREQFGRPIGSFQSIKHLLVEMLCRVEQCAALAWDAARALEDADGQHSLAVAAAAGLALDAAVANAKDCVQVLGGIGFTWEHDAHLYLRRALATRALLGGGPAWRRRTAELAVAGARRELRPPAAETPRREEFRSLISDIAALPVEQQRIAMADNGILAPHWPTPYGLDATPAEQLAIDQELAAAEVRRPDLVIGWWAAPTILKHGSDEQRARFLRPTLRGELTWCQLFSEPGAGSDLASLRTRATKVDGGWSLSGQKVWTSLADRADWAICLARTDPEAPKHKGISYFLVDMTSPGIELRPLREITGDADFNEVFLDELFVPDECLVGEVNGGWKLARTTLANERVAMSGGGTLGEEVENLLDIAVDQGFSLDLGESERLGGLVAGALCNAQLDLRGTLRQLAGEGPGAESSVRKLLGVEHRQAVAEAAVDLHGTQGATADGPLAGLVHELLLTRCLSIAGGTSQILRTVAGERILGLPRES
ncbi:MAG TPA: acyl-CoA dehydrogenase [Pseudonocardiaceae bacterium]|jgi:hypothetical protein|nr:acyl-CoA dehydrogenase [Pseudonocardiaceae bacterium]